MSITGKSFMFTGALSITRNKAQAMVEEAGGIAGASVNHGTDYLVVGSAPGSKLGHAQALGIKILTEEEFFELLKTGGEEILLSAEELEHWDDITPERWTNLKEKNPNLLLMSESQVERILTSKQPAPQTYPPETEMTYYSKANLDKFISANPDFVFTLGPTTCTHCGHENPYTAESGGLWYCFTCLLYYHPGTEARHCCTDWEILDIEVGSGKYRKCKVCGFVQFVTSEEFVERQAGRLSCNFVHSLEFILPIRMATKVLQDEVVTVNYTENYSLEEIAELRQKYETMLVRRQEKRQERFERKQQIRYNHPVDIHSET